MADGIHTSMKTMEPAVLDHPRDRAVAVPERVELPDADDPVLPNRQPGEEPTPWGI
jgi:hypothetical protein